MLRAAVLAVRMTLAPIEAIDVMRFLRVPAIVWVLRRPAGRWCRNRHMRSRRRRTSADAG